jgi:hypothetical protein
MSRYTFWHLLPMPSTDETNTAIEMEGGSALVEPDETLYPKTS